MFLTEDFAQVWNLLENLLTEEMTTINFQKKAFFEEYLSSLSTEDCQKLLCGENSDYYKEQLQNKFSDSFINELFKDIEMLKKREAPELFLKKLLNNNLSQELFSKASIVGEFPLITSPDLSTSSDCLAKYNGLYALYNPATKQFYIGKALRKDNLRGRIRQHNYPSSIEGDSTFHYIRQAISGENNIKNFKVYCLYCLNNLDTNYLSSNDLNKLIYNLEMSLVEPLCKNLVDLNTKIGGQITNNIECTRTSTGGTNIIFQTAQLTDSQQIAILEAFLSTDGLAFSLLGNIKLQTLADHLKVSYDTIVRYNNMFYEPNQALIDTCMAFIAKEQQNASTALAKNKWAQISNNFNFAYKEHCMLLDAISLLCQQKTTDNQTISFERPNNLLYIGLLVRTTTQLENMTIAEQKEYEKAKNTFLTTTRWQEAQASRFLVYGRTTPHRFYNDGSHVTLLGSQIVPGQYSDISLKKKRCLLPGDCENIRNNPSLFSIIITTKEHLIYLSKTEQIIIKKIGAQDI